MTAQLYLDYNASTPVHPAVREACQGFFDRCYANPSAAHAGGREARAALDAARATIARSLGAAPEEIFVTSGGTESNNWALTGSVAVARRLRPDVRPHLVLSRIEHKSVLSTARYLEQQGVELSWLEVGPAGRVALADVERALRPTTTLVAVMVVNNETGALQPAAEIGALCRQRGVRYLADAVCAVGRVPLDVRALNCDLLSLSSHKLYAPKGAGVLYLRRGVELDPLIHGCGQQSGMRGGTENPLPIVGFARALELDAAGAFPSRETLAALRDELWERIRRVAPEARRNGAAPFVGNTLNVTFPGRKAWELQAALAAQGLAVASACAGPGAEPSHVLRAMGLTDELASASLRFSLGAATERATLERVESALATILGVRPAAATGAAQSRGGTR